MKLCNICLGDINQKLLYTSPKTGKRYLSFTMMEKKGIPGEYTLYQYDKQTQEKTFIGSAKQFVKKAEKVENDIPF